jgi:hypothetical protein
MGRTASAAFDANDPNRTYDIVTQNKPWHFNQGDYPALDRRFYPW